MSSLLHTRSGTPLTCGEPSKFDLHKSLAAFDAPVDSEVDRLDTTPTLPNTSNLESAHARTALNTTDQVNGVVEDIREVVPALWGSEHASVHPSGMESQPSDCDKPARVVLDHLPALPESIEEQWESILPGVHPSLASVHCPVVGQCSSCQQTLKWEYQPLHRNGHRLLTEYQRDCGCHNEPDNGVHSEGKTYKVNRGSW
ncbi:hypothetical protein LTR09_007787 [Extremus antarcticus]|uniref:Uncharacterized protein n=1 Tax=Extremus antarcticus TaxID=702011 RepID=A0AAJ0DIU1_9PEZI|nr:hypothetical protein LTR09_007787 [Extremus antarcticus]